VGRTPLRKTRSTASDPAKGFTTSTGTSALGQKWTLRHFQFQRGFHVFRRARGLSGCGRCQGAKRRGGDEACQQTAAGNPDKLVAFVMMVFPNTDVRFTPKSGIGEGDRHIRFVPKADIRHREESKRRLRSLPFE